MSYRVGEKMALPKKVQDQLALFQQTQQQTQVIASQKQNIEFQLSEIERALEALEKVKEGDAVYKSIGSLLIKAENKETVVKDLEEEKETLGVRVKTLGKQVDRMKEKLNELQKGIADAMNMVKGKDASS
jgi:prefoldin beta subunit